MSPKNTKFNRFKMSYPKREEGSTLEQLLARTDPEIVKRAREKADEMSRQIKSDNHDDGAEK